MNKEKFLKIFLIFIAIQPILDLITSVTSFYIDLSVSLNTIIKSIFIIYTIVYLVVFSNSKYKKISLIYLVIIGLYCLIYFITKLDLKTFSNYFNELNYLFKYNYYIFMLIGYLNIFNDTNFDYTNIIKYLKINIFLYFLFLIIPLITKTSLYSYGSTSMGVKGWFVSANEMASLLSLLFALSFLIFTKKRHNKSDYISLVLAGISLALIGTKTSFLSLILTIVVVSFFYFIKNIKSKKTWIGLTIILVTFTISYKYIPGIDIWQGNNIAAESLIEENDSFLTKASKYLLRVRRNLYFEKKDIYINSRTIDKLFGIGLTNREKIDNERISKLVEIDIADIIFSYGIIGLIVYFLPFGYLIYQLIKRKIKIFKSFNNYILTFTIILAFLISIFAGHVFGAPSVSIYLALSYVLLLTSNEEKT